MTRSPAAVALVALVTLTACQAPTPSDSPSAATTSPHSPTPTPSPTCTPEAGGAAYPCTPAQHAAMKEKDALYAEAEAVYRASFAESIRVSRDGGVEEATDIMLATSQGHFLQESVERARSLHERKVRAKGSDPRVVSVDRLPGPAKGGSVVAIRVCVDASGWGFYAGDELVTPGGVAIDDLYFRRFNGSLRIIGADGQDVDSCA